MPKSLWQARIYNKDKGSKDKKVFKRGKVDNKKEENKAAQLLGLGGKDEDGDDSNMPDVPKSEGGGSGGGSGFGGGLF